MKRVVFAVFVMSYLTTWAISGEVGYLETFALAKDRAAALEQLVPGTEEYYYYNCLHFQNTQQYGRVEPLLQAWIKRFNYTARVREIQARQALLTYSQSPEKSLAYIIQTLKLRFDHQREVVGADPKLPTTLDPKLIDQQRLMQDALRRYKNLDGFESTASEWLVHEQLSPERRRELLKRLERPDYPELVRLVLDDLGTKGSRGFGSLPIHHKMLRSQLDACLKAKPDLLNNTQFVSIYLTKMRPSDDIDWLHDRSVRRDYLDQLWQFAGRLGASHNSLKANILYHRLVLDRAMNVYDKVRFMQYITLPRSAAYANRQYVKENGGGSALANLAANFQPQTGMLPIRDDAPLIRSYLSYFFQSENSFDQYKPYLNDIFLKQVFAETKLLYGLGDAEQWSAMLSPEAFRALTQRIDLDFAHTNRTTFAAGEPVQLDVFIKNVPTLIIKIFDINAVNYYRNAGIQVGTDINLDGLVPNFETTYEYKEPPIRRVARHFTFPQLSARGIYVIDLIGNGKSSRVVIHKGQLRFLERYSTAGHILTIIDEDNAPVPEATVWLAGHEYRADKDGTVAVPYTTTPANVPIILSGGKVATLATFAHAAESYQLAAGIYVDRESLRAGRIAKVVLRPMLYLNGTPVTLSVLSDVGLTIGTTDHDGVETTKVVTDFKLTEDRESVYEFRVPQRLDRLEFTLQAKVHIASTNKDITLSTRQQFAINKVDQTDRVAALHLAKADGGYLLEMLGKTGEPLVHTPIQVTLKHRDFRHAVTAMLQTDDTGTIRLGSLRGIATVTTRTPQGQTRAWTIRHNAHSYRDHINAREGDVVSIPWMSQDDAPVSQLASLLEVRAGNFIRNCADHMRIKDGMLNLHDLSRGDYDLYIKPTATHIVISVAHGQHQLGYVLGDHRQLEVRGAAPLQIAPVEVTDNELRVQLSGANRFTRIHVFATRYEPAFWVRDYMGRIVDVNPRQLTLRHLDALYAAGRDIGDEYRYIIDRKYARRYPGNMLQRPSLLLSPWALRSTETGRQQAAAGNNFAPARPPADKRARPAAAKPKSAAVTGDFANLDFLASSSAVLLNLRPDRHGVVTVDRRTLGNHQYVWIVAIDPDDTACRSVTLPIQPRQFIDTRLARSLDVKRHFTQQKQITVVHKGDVFDIDDMRTARIESYDSIARAHQLLVTLSHNSTLVEFEFVTRWNRLSADEKHEKYSKYACHELNYFLYKKDREFFESVVLPFLKNKQDQTFLDRWLIGADLTPYLEAWRYAQLNAVEKILLGQRLSGEHATIQRFIEDQFNLIPPNVQRFNHLFDTALKGSALEAMPTSMSAASWGSLDAKERFGLKLPAIGESLGELAAPRAATKAVEKALQQKAEQPAIETRADDKDGIALGVMPNAFGRGRQAGSAGASRGERGTDLYYKQDLKRRRLGRQLYVALDKTREWAENNYYHVPIEKQAPALVAVNAFWRDYAAHSPATPFASPHLAEASGSFTEMMFALAVSDLPWESPKHKTDLTDNRLEVTARGPMLLIHQEIKPAKKIERSTSILVSQNFFKKDDRYQFVENQRVDKFVMGEFLVHTVYGCQVVVTNPTSTPQRVDALLQVPAGAIPVLKSQQTRSVPLELEPFHTKTLEYYFYFPAPGTFAHYPVHIAKNATLLAAADAVTLKAVKQLSTVDRKSWDYVSQFGTNADVLAFLKTANLQRIKLNRIAFRMQDKAFFAETTALLHERHAYDGTLWSYSLKHDLVPQIRAYLQHANSFVSTCGMVLDSPLLTIDPVVRKRYQHLEYKPLVNARAHTLGRKRQIVNPRLLGQYQNLLRILSYTDHLNDPQRVEVIYYLLLQDRVDEAQQLYATVHPEKLHTRLQFDYITAYLDFYVDKPKHAAAIAVRYADYPVNRWRDAFRAITAQWQEIQGDQTAVVDAKDRDQTQTQLAATEPSLDLEVAADKVHISYQHMKQVQVNYYLMDIELLFSRNPFVQQYTGQFASIRPNKSETVKLPPAQTSHVVDLPKTLRNRNLLVEVRGAGMTQQRAYYANALNVQVLANYGQLKVTRRENGRPLSKVYVKVYARMKDGNVRFYKDGYTDLRGRFDYASLSTNELDAVQKFGILILSDDDGAAVREADAPKR